MKKKFKTITINVEVSSTDNLEDITSKLIQNLSECAVKTVKSEKKWFSKKETIKIDSISVRQFPLNINENEKTL
jgi:hypothetical protein